MDYTNRLAVSYYKTIAVLNEEHKVYLVQHAKTGVIGVKKVINIYNRDVYYYLKQNPILGIPRILELYEEKDCLIVIEEYINGTTLAELMKGPMDAKTVEKYMIGLCEILERLHGLNPPIIHRDIKPSNVIVNSFGQVVLLDFNAAKYYTQSNTADTVLLGTQGYAAPEQYGFSSSSPRTDIYSMGILFRELIESLPEQERGKYFKIIQKCIRIDPKERYASAKQLRMAISSLGNNKKQTKRIWFLPPGFRTLKIWKMLLACFGYIFIGWFSLTLKVENTYGIVLWLERFLLFGISLFLIFFSANYGGIQKMIPLCNSKKKGVRLFGIILWDVIFFFVLTVSFLTLISIIFVL